MRETAIPRIILLLLFLITLPLSAIAFGQNGPSDISQSTQKLLTAIKNGNNEELTALLTYTAIPQNHAERLTLLIAAFELGEDGLPIVRQLIKSGIDINEKINLDRFPLKQKETVEQTDSLPAAMPQPPDSEENVQRDVLDGATLLVLSSIADEIKLLRFLVEQGADVNIETAGEYTPLSLATGNYLNSHPSEKHREILLFFLEHGSDPWKKIKLLPTMQSLDKYRGMSFNFITLAEALNDEKITAALKNRGIIVVPTEEGKQLAGVFNPVKKKAGK